MREYPKPYEIYRHFKGNLYQIIAIAKDSEDGSLKVVYQALYGNYEIYVRDLEMFMSLVDREKYPEAMQEYRFALVDREKVNRDRENAQKQSIGSSVAEAVNKEAVQQMPEPAEAEQTDAGYEESAEGYLDPLLLEFLDSSTYEEKLRILNALHPRITQDMINTIAAALDIEVADGELEERYEQVKNCLLTFEKFECNRLR